MCALALYKVVHKLFEMCLKQHGIPSDRKQHKIVPSISLKIELRLKTIDLSLYFSVSQKFLNTIK